MDRQKGGNITIKLTANIDELEALIQKAEENFKSFKKVLDEINSFKFEALTQKAEICLKNLKKALGNINNFNVEISPIPIWHEDIKRALQGGE